MQIEEGNSICNNFSVYIKTTLLQVKWSIRTDRRRSNSARNLKKIERDGA